MQKILLVLTLGLFAFVPSVAFGVAVGGPCTNNTQCDAGLSCVKEGGAAAGTCEKDVFGTKQIERGTSLGTQDLQTTVTQIINVALSLLGIVAVVIILIGGFEWMTAGGSEDKVESAKKRIMYGIIGLAIILSAWAITKFVLNALGDATNVQGTGVELE